MSKVLKAGDPWMDAYIAQVRQNNKARMKKCHLCEEDATDVTAKEHRVLPICQKHKAIEDINRFAKKQLQEAAETGEVPF